MIGGLGLKQLDYREGGGNGPTEKIEEETNEVKAKIIETTELTEEQKIKAGGIDKGNVGDYPESIVF